MKQICPGWCSSVDWVQTWEPKDHWHMPGLQARSPVGGVQEVTTHWCFSPLSLSFSSPLSKNKYVKPFLKMEQIQPTKPLEFSTVPLFTTRNLMVILEVRMVWVHQHCIPFFSFLFYFWLDTTQIYYFSVSLGQESRLRLTCVVCMAIIKVLVRAGVSSKAQLVKNLLPSSCDCWQDSVLCRLLDAWWLSGRSCLQVFATWPFS